MVIFDKNVSWFSERQLLISSMNSYSRAKLSFEQKFILKLFESIATKQQNTKNLNNKQLSEGDQKARYIISEAL